MTSLEDAILRTLIYADVFQFPLTLPELHRFLIHDQPASEEQLQRVLETSAKLNECIWQEAGYIGLIGNESYLKLRQQREDITQAVWNKAVRYGQWLGNLPFVRMVALTGALSVRNPASLQDDYDYILITKPGRVWLARAFAIVLVRLVKWRGEIICPNYVLAQNQLLQETETLYIAHEVMQMVPMDGAEVYNEMIAINQWTQQYLPNADAYPTPEQHRKPLKRAIEWLLGGAIGDWLEGWEYRRKMRKFAREMQQPTHAAQLDAEHVKGHFQDHGSPVLQRYYEGLAAYNLLPEKFALAGD